MNKIIIKKNIKLKKWIHPTQIIMALQYHRMKNILHMEDKMSN